MPASPIVSLTPVVSGRLASTELNVIEAVRSAVPFRTTISLEAPIALAAVRAAAAEKREFSNFCEVALLEYSRQHGAPAPELIEVFAKLQSAHAAHPAILTEVEKVIRTKLRHGKTKAA